MNGGEVRDRFYMGASWQVQYVRRISSANMGGVRNKKWLIKRLAEVAEEVGVGVGSTWQGGGHAQEQKVASQLRRRGARSFASCSPYEASY